MISIKTIYDLCIDVYGVGGSRLIWSEPQQKTEMTFSLRQNMILWWQNNGDIDNIDIDGDIDP